MRPCCSLKIQQSKSQIDKNNSQIDSHKERKKSFLNEKTLEDYTDAKQDCIMFKEVIQEAKKENDLIFKENDHKRDFYITKDFSEALDYSSSLNTGLQKF